MNPCVRFAPMIGSRPGELTSHETAALQEHLAGCDACQARFADQEALAGMVADALLAEANRRDFSPFSDQVLERIPGYAGAVPARADRSATGAESKHLPDFLARFRTWSRAHRRAFVTALLTPAALAAALVLYFASGSSDQRIALVEVNAEGRGAIVLQTKDGPVVLIGSEEPEGT